MDRPGQFNQFNTINWYQQTWHTIEFSNNRHTRHHHNLSRGSLRSNFPNLPEPAELCKPAFPRSTTPPTRIPTHTRHAKLRTISRLFIRGSVANSPHQRRRLELLYTPHRPHTNPPPHHPPHPKNPATTPKPTPPGPPRTPSAQETLPVGCITCIRGSFPFYDQEVMAERRRHRPDLLHRCPDRPPPACPGAKSPPG